MSERIKELREQAWALVSNEERDRGELYEAREQWERCDQKFAELVRADEREARAKFFDDNDTNMFWGSQAAQHIRARSTK